MAYQKVLTQVTMSFSFTKHQQVTNIVIYSEVFKFCPQVEHDNILK